MRERLKNMGVQERHTFNAEIVRFGHKIGWKGRDIRTVLVKDVKCGDRIVTDHLWFTFGKQMEDANIEQGDKIEFCARVASYMKGYCGRREDVWDRPIEEDWKLSFPTKVRKINANVLQEDMFRDPI